VPILYKTLPFFLATYLSPHVFFFFFPRICGRLFQRGKKKILRREKLNKEKLKGRKQWVKKERKGKVKKGKKENSSCY